MGLEMLVAAELSKPGYKPERIHIGGNTDPYQPVERKLKVTRAVLEVLDRFNHPFSVITLATTTLARNAAPRRADVSGDPLSRKTLIATISGTRKKNASGFSQQSGKQSRLRIEARST